jgi:hypothetical protein
MPSLVQKDDVAQPGYSSYPYNNTNQAREGNADYSGAVEPTAQIVANQMLIPEEALAGEFMSMNEVVQTVAALPANVDAIANIPREFDAQAVYPGDACLFVAK